MGFFDFLQEHFLHALPILIAGGFATAIFVERTRALFKTYPLQDTEGFFDKVRELVMGGKPSEALSLCDRYSEKPMAKVVRAGLLRAHQPENLIEHGLEIAVGDESQKISKRTAFLSTIANVATLLGLFGTIAGLIQSFEAVGHADAQQKSALLSAGIAAAMNATMLGLAVAIPSMIAFAFLTNRTNRLTAELENGAVRTLDLLKQRYYQAESEAFEQAANGASGGGAKLQAVK